MARFVSPVFTGIFCIATANRLRPVGLFWVVHMFVHMAPPVLLMNELTLGLNF